ncbi:hypothetical protein ABW99_06840 [Pandoraea thiooxydans]|uniref:Entericidin n=1 Tax=Pandoraea thiooxydans TaxID=445709 RepID=A0A0G3EM02_9BURK|nr:hypothetical protein [Pandoraea thiooxydans]AKJ67975.1 hypothetical protein ABW99_06840 [Pandoraea thiooxydans]
MNRRNGKVIVVLATSVLVLALSACQKPEGPAQRAGKAVDSAASNAGQQIENAGDNIKNAAKKDSK